MTEVATSTSFKIKSTDRQQHDESQSSHHSNFLFIMHREILLEATRRRDCRSIWDQNTIVVYMGSVLQRSVGH